MPNRANTLTNATGAPDEPTDPPIAPIDDGAVDVDLEHLPMEARIQLALTAIEVSGTSERKAALYYRVNRGTLQNRIKGIQPRGEAHVEERKLTRAQEDVLTEWVKVSDLLQRAVIFF